MIRVTVIAALIAVLVPTMTVAAGGPIVLPPSLGKPVLKGARDFTDRTVNERVRAPQPPPPPNEESPQARPKQPSAKKTPPSK